MYYHRAISVMVTGNALSYGIWLGKYPLSVVYSSLVEITLLTGLPKVHRVYCQSTT